MDWNRLIIIYFIKNKDFLNGTMVTIANAEKRVLDSILEPNKPLFVKNLIN